jgi:nitrate reductase NapAB chaperone NapD
MPISSYVVFPEAGKVETLLESLMVMPNVEIEVSEDQKALVLVSETISVKAEEAFQKELGNLNGIQAFTYVFGHEIPEE